MPLPATIINANSWSNWKGNVQGPFEHSNGDLYTFAIDYVTNHLECWRSTDGGNTWSEADAANHPAIGTTNGQKSIHAVQDGNLLWVWRFTSATSGALRTFSMVTNTWGPASTLLSDFAATDYNAGAYYAILVGPRNTDTWTIVRARAQERVMGTDYYRVGSDNYLTGTDTWNTGSGPDLGTGGEQLHHIAAQAIRVGDRAHTFHATANSPQSFRHQSITPTNGLGTVQDVDASVNIGASYQIGIPCLNGTEVIVPFIDTGGELKVARATSADNPTWSIQTVSGTATNDPEVTGSTMGAVVAVSGVVYAFWPDDTTQDIWTSNDQGTGTWTTPTEWKDAVNVNAINVAAVTGGIGVLYADGATLKYDLYSLGNPPIELDGVATGTSAASAVDISVGHPLEGTAAGTASASAGRLVLTHPLSGTAAGTSSATGNLFVPADALAGTSAGVSDASAFGLRLDIPLEGTATGTASATADILSVGHPLDGAAVGSSDASAADISVGHPLTGEAAGTSTASADLTVAAVSRLLVYWVELETPSTAQSHPLDGVSTGTSDASALRLTLEHPLAASAIGVSDASALDLNVGHPLVGESAGLGYAEVPSLNVGHTLSGQTAGLGAAEAGALSVGHPLASESVGTSDALASRLEVGHTLSGEAIGTSAALASLNVDGDVSLVGTAVGTSSASAILSMAHPLTGAVTGSSAASADSLHVGHSLVGTVSGVSDALAQRLTVSHVLEGEALGTSDGLVPTLLVGHALEGAAAGLGFASAQRLRLDMPLLGSSLGYSEAMAGAILVGHVLSGDSLGTSHAFGVLGPVQLRPRSHLVMVG